MNVYLAGTISKDPKTLGWREEVAKKLRKWRHTPLSPLRYQNPEEFSENGLHDDSVPDSFFVDVDLSDLKRADVVFVVYWQGEQIVTLKDDHRMVLSYKRQSIGTWSEFAIAFWENKPIIIVTDDPDVADHPFTKRKAAIVCKTVEEGLEWLGKMLV